MNWISIKKQIPPKDLPILVRGMDMQGEFFCAFNSLMSVSTTASKGDAWWNSEMYPLWKVIEDKAKKEEA